MKNKIISYLVICITIVLLTLPPFKISDAYGDIVRGDVSGEGQVNLQNAIHVPQGLSGVTPSTTISKQADVKGDQRMGAMEAVYTLLLQDGKLKINSLSTLSVVPASLLTISGSGFDPENSAISVLFTPEGSGIPIAIPVFSASANSINVIVPSFLDSTSGFSSGVMTVQAIQVSGSSLLTSNTIGGLNVGPLPSIPTSNPAGAVTGAWINSGLIVLQNIQTYAGSTPTYADLLSASNTLGSDLISSLQAIDLIKTDPALTRNLATLDGSAFVLDAATLAASDRLVVAYLQQFLDFVQTPPDVSPKSLVQPEAKLAAGCVTDLDTVTGNMICDGRTYNQQFAQVGSAVLPPAAAFVYGQWLSLTGSYAAAGFLAAGVSKAAVNAFQLVWAGSGPYVSALAAGGPAPTLKAPATEVAMTLIDRVLNGAGTMLSGVFFAADLFSTANQVSSAPMGSAPTGGLIVSDPTTLSPPGSNALLRVLGSGANASVLSVMAPKTQAIVSLLCTYSYSDWSACQPNNTQTRTVISGSPAGCVGTPVLSQSCTYQDDTCCACTFDVYCTVFGAGGCWICHNSIYSGGECQAPYGYLTSPGACTCDPEFYAVCQ
jgi:hypothetical protein